MSVKATTKIFFDKYHPKKNNKCSISIQVYNEGKRQLYPTDFKLTVEEYNNVISGKKVSKEIKEDWLKIISLEKKAVDIIKEMPYFSWDAFEKQFLSSRGNRCKIESAFDEYIKNLKEENRIGTA